MSYAISRAKRIKQQAEFGINMTDDENLLEILRDISKDAQRIIVDQEAEDFHYPRQRD